MVAIAGSVVKHPASATFRKSLPSGARTWRFAFGGFVGAASHKATVNVRCVGLSVPTRAGKVALNVNTVSHGVGVDALDRAETRIDCRKGYVPTAWGFDIPAPSTTQDVLPPEELSVYKALADSRGFAFGLENLGAGGHVARLRVRCLQRTAAGKAGLSHTWQLTRQRRSQRIRSGVRTVRHSCASLSLSIGLGHSIAPADDVIFRRSYDGEDPVGRLGVRQRERHRQGDHPAELSEHEHDLPLAPPAHHDHDAAHDQGEQEQLEAECEGHALALGGAADGRERDRRAEEERERPQQRVAVHGRRTLRAG